MKIIASIEDPVVIGKILAHLEQATPTIKVWEQYYPDMLQTAGKVSFVPQTGHGSVPGL